MAGVMDTSVLYALLDEADPNHHAARDMVDAHMGVELPPAVVAELELLTRKRAGLVVSRQLMTTFLSDNPHVGVMDADLHPEAMDVWQRNGRLSYTDCHAIAGALLLDNTLITLDKRQAAVWRQERKRG